MRITEIDTMKKAVVDLKRVAGYGRVSVDRTASAESLKTQKDYLQKKIRSTRGWVDCGVFLDLGITGTKTNRPGFRALMEKCDRGEVDMIITKSISRFCRNTIDLLATVRHLKEKRVEVWFDENGLSTFSKEGELLLTLLAAQAQEESRSISENVLWTFRKKFENGEGLPHDLIGYRWDGTGYRIVEDEAKVVRMIFDLYLSGLGPKQISNILNESGVKGLYGRPMSYEAVGVILRQEKYMGDSILQKTYTENHITHKLIRNKGERDRYYVEGTHPPILDEGVFERTQKEMERRRLAGALECNWKLNTSAFTSKVVCCHCGRTFRRKVFTREKYPTYYSWVCGEKFDRKSGGCSSKGVPEWALYSMTGKVLEKDDFSVDDFNASIDHIEAGLYHEVTFCMKDGRRIRQTWENQSRRKDGREC